MLFTEEDLRVLGRIRDKILKVIDKEFEKAGIDQTYFEFEVKVNVLESGSFRKVGELTLIDDHQGFCIFCGKKSYYYDHDLRAYVCAECYGKKINR